MRRHILTALALCLAYPLAVHAADQAPDARAADHAALRALLAETTAALNASDIDKLKGCLAPQFHITFADQRHFRDIPALKAYADELRQGRGITKIAFAPTADALTDFIGPDAGVCTGTSIDTFTGADGSTTTLTSRWTATVVRDQGTWKVAAVQAGVDLLDNPVLSRVSALGMRIAVLAGIAGVVLGLLLGVVFFRRRAA